MKPGLIGAIALALASTAALAGASDLAGDVRDYRVCVQRSVAMSEPACGTRPQLGRTRDVCGYSLSHVQAELAEMHGSLAIADRAVTRLVDAEEAKALVVLARAQARQCAVPTPAAEGALAPEAATK